MKRNIIDTIIIMLIILDIFISIKCNLFWSIRWFGLCMAIILIGLYGFIKLYKIKNE
jgi:hypothetical protein